MTKPTKPSPKPKPGGYKPTSGGSGTDNPPPKPGGK